MLDIRLAGDAGMLNKKISANKQSFEYWAKSSGEISKLKEMHQRMDALLSNLYENLKNKESELNDKELELNDKEYACNQKIKKAYEAIEILNAKKQEIEELIERTYQRTRESENRELTLEAQIKELKQALEESYERNAELRVANKNDAKRTKYTENWNNYDQKSNHIDSHFSTSVGNFGNKIYQNDEMRHSVKKEEENKRIIELEKKMDRLNMQMTKKFERLSEQMSEILKNMSGPYSVGSYREDMFDTE